MQGDAVPSIEEKQIKCLRKWFDSSLTDKNITRTEKQSEKSGLHLKFKAWLYQHALWAIFT